MQKCTVKMGCRQRNRQWNVDYNFVEAIVLLRKFVLRTNEKEKTREKQKEQIPVKFP